MQKILLSSLITIIFFTSFLGQDASAGLFKRKKKPETKIEMSSEAILSGERGKKFLEENMRKEGVFVSKSGLQLKPLKSGDLNARKPFKADIVIVHYEGRLIDGTVFESTLGKEPYEEYIFHLIPGWAEGMMSMKVGDKFQFFLPPELAYGLVGKAGKIGPNETLIIDVELIEVIRTGLTQ